MVGDAVAADEGDEVLYRVAGEGRDGEARVVRQEAVGRRVLVGEVAAPAARNQDLLARLVRVVEQQLSRFAALPAAEIALLLLVLWGISSMLTPEEALTFLVAGILGLVTFIAVWAIVLGVMEIIGAIKLRKEIQGEWLLILNGVISVLFGLVLLWRPVTGAIALVWIIGAYAIILGVIYVMFGLKLRKHAPAA